MPVSLHTLKEKIKFTKPAGRRDIATSIFHDEDDVFLEMGEDSGILFNWVVILKQRRTDRHNIGIMPFSRCITIHIFEEMVAAGPSLLKRSNVC